MKLDVSGHPLHSRVLTIDVSAHDGGKFSARGILLDLRKHGFLPLTGYLQPSGIIHHMQLDAVIDPETRTLESIIALQPAVAYESSPLTQMENCRDPIRAVEDLAGTRLDDQYRRRLNRAIGGPRGCNHLLTLAQLMGSSLDRVFKREKQAEGEKLSWSPGARVFQRALTVDGFECTGGTAKIAVQLVDLLLKPAPADVYPMDHFKSQLEVWVLAEIDTNTMSINHITAAKRRRNAENLAGVQWQDLNESVKNLAGLGVMSGLSGILFRSIGRRPSERPLLDALLNLAPGFIQCIASMSETHPVNARNNQSLLGMGKDGPVENACYMWRKGGALIQIREREQMRGARSVCDNSEKR